LYSRSRLLFSAFLPIRRRKMNKGNITAVIVGGLLLALFVVLAVVLHASAYFCAGRGWGIIGPRMMYGFGGGWFMGILMLAVVGLFIWGLIALVQRGGRPMVVVQLTPRPWIFLKSAMPRGKLTRNSLSRSRKICSRLPVCFSTSGTKLAVSHYL